MGPHRHAHALRVRADHLEPRGHVLAQAGEGRQEHGEALALLLPAHEDDPEGVSEPDASR